MSLFDGGPFYLSARIRDLDPCQPYVATYCRSGTCVESRLVDVARWIDRGYGALTVQQLSDRLACPACGHRGLDLMPDHPPEIVAIWRAFPGARFRYGRKKIAA